MKAASEEKCMYCGGYSNVEGEVCSNCRSKIPVVHRFLKAARELRERLNTLEAAEQLERRRKHGR